MNNLKNNSLYNTTSGEQSNASGDNISPQPLQDARAKESDNSLNPIQTARHNTYRRSASRKMFIVGELKKSPMLWDLIKIEQLLHEKEDQGIIQNFPYCFTVAYALVKIAYKNRNPRFEVTYHQLSQISGIAVSTLYRVISELELAGIFKLIKRRNQRKPNCYILMEVGIQKHKPATTFKPQTTGDAALPASNASVAARESTSPEQVKPQVKSQTYLPTETNCHTSRSKSMTSISETMTSPTERPDLSLSYMSHLPQRKNTSPIERHIKILFIEDIKDFFIKEACIKKEDSSRDVDDGSRDENEKNLISLYRDRQLNKKDEDLQRGSCAEPYHNNDPDYGIETAVESLQVKTSNNAGAEAMKKNVPPDDSIVTIMNKIKIVKEKLRSVSRELDELKYNGQFASQSDRERYYQLKPQKKELEENLDALYISAGMDFMVDPKNRNQSEPVKK